MAENGNINLDVSVNGLEEAQFKATLLALTIKSAKTLAGELADLLEKLSVDVK